MQDSLEKTIIHRLTDKQCTLATAESCTGGLIAHRLTNVPGSSVPFLGGVIAYANSVKVDILGVDSDTLQIQGAVCADVAGQMACGVRARLGADYGVGITGIAGPGGGTPAKPVGLVYIAVADDYGPRIVEARFDNTGTTPDREAIKSMTADTALKMILETIT